MEAGEVRENEGRLQTKVLYLPDTNQRLFYYIHANKPLISLGGKRGGLAGNGQAKDASF